MRSWLAFLVAASMAALLPPQPAGATAGDDRWAAEAVEPADPLEPVNRAIFELNLKLYDKVLDPAYRAYIDGVCRNRRAK